MYALAAKGLTIVLAGILALPPGYCCQKQTICSPAPPAAGHCHRTSDQSGHAPITATRPCCGQPRLTAIEVTQVRKRAVSELLGLATFTFAQASAHTGGWETLSPARLFPPGKHSLQATLCVWRL
jgi:hypothetical protein